MCNENFDICSEPGCFNFVKIKPNGKPLAKCEKHHISVEYKPKKCVVDGCCNNAMKWTCHKLCDHHYEESKPKPKKCAKEGCDSNTNSKKSKYCKLHLDAKERDREYNRKRRAEEKLINENKKEEKLAKKICIYPGCNKQPENLIFGKFCQEHKEIREEERKEAKKLIEQEAKKNIPFIPKKCTVLGCDKDAANPVCGKLCEEHRIFNAKEAKRIKNRKNRKRKRFSKKPSWKNSYPCWICGWNQATCDQHRLVAGKDGGIYSIDNVVSLCPNCHRVVTDKPLEIFRMIRDGILKNQEISNHLLDIADTLPKLWKNIMSEIVKKSVA